MKSTIERHKWLMNQLHTKENHSLDVLNSSLVDEYALANECKVGFQPFGANTCRQLGKDLSALFNEGKLERFATGLTGMAGMGFPRWVYVYSLPKEKK